MLRKFRRLFPYIARRWPTLAVIVALTTAGSAVTVLQPWPLKVLVDDALAAAAPHAPLRSLLTTLGLQPTAGVLIVIAGLGSFVLVLLSTALDMGLSWAWTAAGQRMVYDLAEDLFARLQRLSLLFHAHRSVGEWLDRLSSDSWCAYALADGLLIAPAQQLLTVSGIAFAAWSLDPQLTLLTLATAPLLAGTAGFFGPRLKRRARQGREAQSRLSGFIHQTLSSVTVVQVFGAEDRNAARFGSLARGAVTAARADALLNSAYGWVASLTTTCGAAVVLYAGGRRVLAGELSVGSLLVFVAYLRSLQGAFQGLLLTYGKLQAAEASVDRVLEILDAEDTVREAPHAKALSAAPAGQGAHIRIEQVTFGYTPGVPVLHEVTLDLRPGETLAIVGPTGAGKSTLASLIPRFADPWKGRVLFDGLDLRAVQLRSLRTRVAVVLQEPFLLPLSVAENIGYGRPDASRAEIEAAAVAARAHSFIERLPEGYDTLLGEQGATLSGGERQRLAIARALLKNAPVVILDEPTAALDAETESSLLDALERLVEGRTAVIIAHRLSTIRRANRIVVLDGGRLIEAGSHQELLAGGGLYHRLHRLQFLPASEEVAP